MLHCEQVVYSDWKQLLAAFKNNQAVRVNQMFKLQAGKTNKELMLESLLEPREPAGGATPDRCGHLIHCY